jgi:hypothetical protein
MIYVFFYSGVGHDDNPDVDQLPDAVPRGTFNPVPLSDDQPSIVTFDLETTDLSMIFHILVYFSKIILSNTFYFH